ncbi:FkbM family methyltransferase [Arcobacter sp. LA11]|uniref:FkbM family methyltransferase n=1 Tax=Arcobacter sp. LA11 TaxID=1898176 RepID=UPI000933913C|nr:FkbM family methyltransferase [Arcobacter sp. LA11]
MKIGKILEMDLNIEPIPLEDEIIIYGAGNFGRLYASILKKRGYSIQFFVDKEKCKNHKFIDDIPVINLSNKELLDKRDSLTCVIGIFNAYIDLSEIEKELILIGFRKVINHISFYDLFSNEIGDYFWLSEKKNHLKNRNRILDSYKLLEDKKSRKLFKNILKYRMFNNLNKIQKPQKMDNEYFPKDINCKYPILKFVDCGAYDGDTVLRILKKKIPLSSYTAFEPDLRNANLLSENIKKKLKVESHIYPCGLWNKTDKLKFSGGTGSSSHINLNGDDIISVVSIDECIINKKVNFIKMDIEGAEVQALIGAKETIKKNKPILAISAYHKYDDLWTILETIKSFNIDYKFYMRMYEYNGFGIVYYAVPNKYQV